MDTNDNELNLPKREEEILTFWLRNRIFEKTLAQTKKGKRFVFFEGPPFANGLPGIHHMEARIMKDVFLRFKTMQGFYVRRKAGWDTHGLPIELAVEKQLGLKNKKDIERYGIGAFNRMCRENVWKYKDEWDAFTKRIGFWLDLAHPYITYETNYIESLWYIIKRFWETNVLYQGRKIIPWCPRCGTGLSSHELGQPGVYRTVKDPSLYVKFPIRGKKNESLLVWTTTPWTLPGNVLVAVNPKIEYKKYKVLRSASSAPHSDYEYIWSAHLPVFSKEQTAEYTEKKIGKDIIGLAYEAPYPTKDQHVPYTVVGADFVTAEDGTGIVHIAPAFGEDDMRAAKKEFGENYPIIMSATPEGQMAKGFIGEGKPVRDANKDIGRDLEERGLLLKLAWYDHDYPHCWRCDTPLLYLARESWWVKKPVAQLVENNKKVQWIPEHMRDGRFGEWLGEPKDWAFSRERYWGTPLPIWRCGACAHTEVIGSIAELLEKSEKPKNRYFLMRHGESEANMIRVIDDSNTYHLTEKGKREVDRALPKLKREGIDLIIASDVLRTKETAERIAAALGTGPVVYDERLREIHLGALEGKPTKAYHEAFPTYEKKFADRPEGGESLVDLRARLVTFMKDTEEAYAGRTILIVSHEYPIWMVWSAGQGMDQEGIAAAKRRRDPGDFIKTAGILPFPFKKLPYSDTGEVDLHRPFIDEIGIPCPRCGPAEGVLMKRVPDVCDVWFDSGAMPFAEDHWPFQYQKSKIKSKKVGKKLSPPEFFPAEFISEGVDQTRGWFYTLLTVSTLLGYGSPYEHVLVLGHVLDEKGRKMSKSRGNVVIPKELIERYGVDALRWYFYTVNAPDDAKAFDEKDVIQRLRGFLNTFWNSYLLFETYAPKKIQISNLKSQNVLDRWILSRLQNLIRHVTFRLEHYEPVAAARALEAFVVGDFSQWYLRRSRRRFQKPESKADLAAVSAVTAHVLSELVKLSAPFVPFFSDIVFRRLRGRIGAREESVHLARWPKERALFNISHDADVHMEKIRAWAARALQERARAGIKVRQPLAEFVINRAEYGRKEPFSEELLEILRDEINVKKISWGDTSALDTALTNDLREEGFIRELIRTIQEMRKDGGMQPKDAIFIHVETDAKIQGVIEKWNYFIKKEVGAKSIAFGGKRQCTVEREMKERQSLVWIGIRK